MTGYVGPIEQLTKENTSYRNVLFTTAHLQLVLMSLLPGEEIGQETHPDNDQFFRFEGGEGKVIIDGQEHIVHDGVAVVVPAGARHNIINTSSQTSLKLYTIYAPPHHPDGTHHKTKADDPES